jgi:hypothetical protein
MNLLGLAALVAAMVCLPAAAQPAREPPPLLTVTGTGEVRAEPDEASVRLGVTRQMPTAQAAQEEVSRTAQAILDGILKVGIRREAVQTSTLQLYPIYAPQRPQAAEEPRVVAYRAANVVTVRVEELKKVGPVIDAGLKAGANQLEGVSFRLKDDLPARERALREAVQEARRKAATIAQALEVRLGPVHEVQEGGAAVIPPPLLRGEAFMARGAAAPETPVSPGQVTISASVTVRYRIGER